MIEMTKKIEDEILKKQGGTADLDPRCKIFLVFGVSVVSLILGGEMTGAILMLALFLLVSLGGGLKMAIKAMVIYVAVCYLNVLLRLVVIPGISLIMIVFGVMVTKVIPIVLIARWTHRTTHMDDLMVGLQRMKLPQAIIIPLMVMFRYIPTIHLEYKIIRNNMRIRGINHSFSKSLLHPVTSMEYVLVPLLMRCLKVSDELAASGITRGLGKDITRFSIHPVRFTKVDVLALILALLVFLALVILDKTQIGNIVLWRL